MVQRQISATFDSIDEAERAISRLRRSVAAYTVSTEGEYSGSLPAEAPFTANLYFPYHPVNYTVNELNTLPYEIGGRVLLTSDIMGLPIYRQSPTDIQITLPDSQAQRARAILVNAGAHHITLR